MLKGTRFALSTASRVNLRSSVPALFRTAHHVAFQRNFSALSVRSPVKLSQVLPCASNIRLYGSSTRVVDEPAREVEYKDVKKLVEHPDPNVVLVDVREPAEYDDGHIPNAINIPFKSMPGALGLEGPEFESTLGFPKPDTSKTLLFYCLGGVRSTGSEQIASTYGYRNRWNYKGSYGDWAKHEQAKQKVANSN